jgi:hypothetical protein
MTVSLANDPTRAERQRRHQSRRRVGLFVVQHEIHEDDIDELIEAGLLDPGQDYSREEIGRAVSKAFRSWIESRGQKNTNALDREGQN